MASRFHDHFSGHASEYAAARPRYPHALFDYLTSLCRRRTSAWDCATGSGQAATALAHTFEKVIATDASAQQIEHATHADNVHYRVAPAEASGIDPGSIDLITVAQAIHWFDVDRFHEEVNRVAANNAIIAVWCYGQTSISPDIDTTILDFHGGEMAPYWPAERSHVESAYRDLPFPYESIASPCFEMRVKWNADALLAYLRTWSSVRRFKAAHGSDPVAKIDGRIRKRWGRGARHVMWPLILKVGRVNSS